MKEVELADTGSLMALLVPANSSAHILDNGVSVAVVLSSNQMAAIDATLAVLATNGALAAIAEGLADLDAGRTDAWGALRGDYVRTADEDGPETAAGPRVSHRARWDLELLPPNIAQRCFEALDVMTDVTVTERGMPMVAAFGRLQIFAEHGYRMLIRPVGGAVEIVHIDTGTIEATIQN